ncbi:MAG: outer membrane lipid asymmetry maintenance protein MlaD, partial [Rhodospirillaceae bacterium TMED167]
MQRNLAETVMGAVVLIVAGLFLYFFMTTAQIQTVQGYSVSARFGNIGGLQAGSDVRISGIAVGSVLDRSIDPETYEAVV